MTTAKAARLYEAHQPLRVGSIPAREPQPEDPPAAVRAIIEPAA